MSGSDLAEVAYEEAASGVWVGRAGGLLGSPVADDIATGCWRTRHYKVVTGTTAPQGQWFALEAFLDKVSEARIAVRAAAGWERVGVLSAEASAVAFAVPGARLPLAPDSDIRDGHADMVGFITLEDKFLPVEVRKSGGVLVEARVDVVYDVDDQPGTWRAHGTLDVEVDGVVVVNPYLSGDQARVVVPLRPGRWRGEVFNLDGDDLALRLVPERSGIDSKAGNEHSRCSRTKPRGY